MNVSRLLGLVVLTWAITGCQCSNPLLHIDGGLEGGADAGVQPDAGTLDGGPDTGIQPDAGALDGGPDAGTQPDAGALDGGSVDAGLLDAGSSDGGNDGEVDGGPQPLCIGQWCWSNPLPQGNPLRAVAASSQSDVWVVGDRGTALHFDGLRWTHHPVSPDLYLTGVWTAANRTWATAGRYWYGGSDGGPTGLLSGVILQQDAGTWSSLEVSTGLTAISGTSPSDVWVVGWDGGLHYDGVSWQANLPAGGITSVWATSPNDVWTFGQVVRRWNGVTWSAVSAYTAYPSSSSVWASGPNDAWAVNAGGALSRWDGGTWTTDFSTVTGQTTIWGAGRDDVWVAGDGFPLLHFDGNTWSTSATSASIVDLAGTSGTDVWGVGPSGTIIHWDGTQWRPSSRNAATPQGFVCTALWASAANNLWAVGGETMLHGDGSTWTRYTSPKPGVTLYAVWGSGPNDVWAVGDSVALHWDGTTWSAPANSGTMTLLGVWGSGPSDVWAAGYIKGVNQGVLYRWNGTVWSVVPNVPPFFPIGIWGTSPGDVWLASSMGSVLHWNGSAWTTTSSFVGTDGVWFGSASDIWSWDDASHMFVHWDGLSWTSKPSPVGASASFSGFSGSGPQDVWAFGYDKTTASGIVARWRGTQWEIDPLPPVPQLGAMWVVAPGDVWIGGRDSAILHRRP